MTSVAPPTEFFPGIDFNPSFYNLGQSAVTLDYLNSNFLRSTGYAISRAQFTLFNGTVDINENLDVSGNINASAYLLNGVPFTPSQWTTSVNDIYYTTGNVGIGKTNPTYKLDVSGNVNCNAIFTNGTQLTQYTDANVRTVLGTSAGTNMTWNTGTNKFDVAAPYTDTNVRTVLSTSAGSNMTWNTGTNKFDVSVVFPPSYTDTNTRTVLSTSAGTNMTWNTGTNKFDVAVTSYTLPTAGTGTGGTLGGVKVDGTTISINASTGVISRTGNTILLNVTTTGEYYGWTGLSSGLFRVGTNGQYSTGSLVEDIVLRSNGDVLLQSGIGNYGMRINTSNNILMRNAVGVGSTSITAGFNLDVTGNVTMRNAACIGSTTITSGFILDITGNVAMRTGLVVGGTAITSGYTLDVKGDVITSGNINLANTSRSLFWGGTNSNLGRAGAAGQFSSSSVIDDIVLRSGNRLLLQSGTGVAGVVIDTANNVGIGITNPSVRLDINGNVKIQASRVAIQSSGFAINNNYMYPDTLTIGNQDINYGGGQNWNTNTASLMFECRDHTEIAVHDSGNYVHSFMWYYQNAFTIGRNMGWGAPNVNIAGNLIVAGNLNVNTSKLVIRGTEPTLYLRDTNNRSGMIHMNSSIMYFLNASGNDSETWAQQNGQDWCLQLNMDNNTATFGGNLNVNGNIAHRTENWHTSSDGRNRFYFSASNATYYSGGMSGGANARMHEWRRTYDDATLGWFENTGLLRSYGYSSLSDSRIKKNIRDIDDTQGLEKILLIQPKKYNYIEKERNKHDVIGFIAQQIGEVIPEAITKTEGIVPNIYKNCLVNNKREIYYSLPLDVVIDTDVIITDTEDGTGERYKIKEIYDDYFIIDKDIDRDEVFVKGYSINDLHNLDKNYIYTLNVCATQELYKLIMEQREEINNLKNRLSTLENINNRQ
jgi:hypothetical protein